MDNTKGCYGIFGQAEPIMKFFLDYPSKRMVIPPYQRAYCWNRDNCKRLFDDLCELTEPESVGRGHFFGTIVSVLEDSGCGDILIIDGQQRLITLSLLIFAARSLKIRCANEFDGFLWIKDGTVSRLDLSHVDNDGKAYEKIANDVPDEEFLSQDSPIIRNYLDFKNIFREQRDGNAILEAIKRLVVIQMLLKPDGENPQLIFDSINATGRELSEGDKICNYLLDDLKLEKQDFYFKEYWKKIYANVSETGKAKGVSAFIRTFLMARVPSEKQIAKEGETYERFKEYCRSSESRFNDRDSFFEELKRESANYNYLLKPAAFEKAKQGKIYVAIAIYLEYIRRQSITAANPFLLALLGKLSEQNAEDVLKVLQIVDAFLFRRKVCKKPSNSLQGIFVKLARILINEKELGCSLSDWVLVRLLSNSGNASFPNDDEFKKALTDLDIYTKLGQPDKKYFFARLWNGLDGLASVEIDETYRALTSSEPTKANVYTYTIEHVFPQHPENGWKDDLGNDEFVVTQALLHKLGNLTLTPYNPELSNKQFAKKCEEGFRFKDKGRSNPLVADIIAVFKAGKKWNSQAIRERGISLADRALRLWPIPKLSVAGERMLGDVRTRKEIAVRFGIVAHKVSALSGVHTAYKVLMQRIWSAFVSDAECAKALGDAGFIVAKNVASHYRQYLDYGMGFQSFHLVLQYSSQKKYAAAMIYGECKNWGNLTSFLVHKDEILTMLSRNGFSNIVYPMEGDPSFRLMLKTDWDATENGAKALFPWLCKAAVELKAIAREYGSLGS